MRFMGTSRTLMIPISFLRCSTKFIVLISSIVLTACSTLEVVNIFVPEEGSSVNRGIAYGAHQRQHLDFYSPEQPAQDSAVIMFFYGGGWQSGKREEYEFVARKIAAQGHYVVVPDYRLYPEVIFPGFVLDGARATAYVFDHLEELTGETRPVYLMGHSAGAHIAMLLAVDPRYLDVYGKLPQQLAGVVGLAGPYDFLPLTSRRLEQIFPDQGERYQSQPVHFANSEAPPVFLAHGDNDDKVWLRNSVNMAEKLRKYGGEVSLQIYPGADHVDLIRPFLPFQQDQNGLIQEILAFVSTPQAE